MIDKYTLLNNVHTLLARTQNRDPVQEAVHIQRHIHRTNATAKQGLFSFCVLSVLLIRLRFYLHYTQIFHFDESIHTSDTYIWTGLDLRSSGIFHPLGAVLHLLCSLLRIHSTVLRASCVTKVNLCLPSRYTHKKHFLDVFKTLACGFREQEKCMDCHGYAEDAKDDIHPPLDIDECRRYKVRESKVEYPVATCSDHQQISRCLGVKFLDENLR
jgi:hypothetical protein